MTQYGYVYILASKGKRLYIGVTTRLERRIHEHKTKAAPHCFTARYNIDQLVYFERHPLVVAAIAREKELKGWRRTRKIALIVECNPTWKDLSLEWGQRIDAPLAAQPNCAPRDARLKGGAQGGRVLGGAAGVIGPRAPDRQLNPNNPYAALGASARLYYLFGDIPQYTVRRNDLYRVAGGVNGSLGNGFNFTVEGVYAKDNFSIENHGNISITNVLQAINTGAYNFVNPQLNSAAVRNFVSPTYTVPSYSAEASLDASISKSFYHLPGGDLQLLVGAQVRRENENNRSDNPLGTVTIPGGTTYTSPLYFSGNTSSAFGRHTVSSGFFEVDAPILTHLEVNA